MGTKVLKFNEIARQLFEFEATVTVHMKNNSIHAWQHRAALAVAFALLHAGEAIALETDYLETERLSLFSPTFINELDLANRSTDPVGQLEAVYRRFTRPAEQLETELTIARLLSQQKRFVNRAESLTWYDKALMRELPAITLARHLILRGNTHEQLDHHELALADYVRGLLVCLQFNLPDVWPQRDDGTGTLRLPPIDSRMDSDGDKTEIQHLAERQRKLDYDRDFEMTRREQFLLQQRYYYIDAIKRVLKSRELSEAALRDLAAGLTNRKDRVEEVLRRVRAQNPRPWP
jgi:hypothetical protein